MIVFNVNNSAHNIIVTPRKYSESAFLTLRHELKDRTFTFPDLQAVKDNGYLRVNFTFTFKEGESYEITLTSESNELLWRGKGYATTETDLENYKLL